MKSYCKLCQKMRPLLHRYFGTPEKVRELSIEEYYTRRDGRPFMGREPRQFMDLQLKKARYEKLLEIHESGLFQNILDSDIEWAEDNKDIIAKKLEIWASILDAKQLNIVGAMEIHNEE